MKAKDIAKSILDESSADNVDKLKVSVNSAYAIIKEAAEKAKKMQQLASKLAVWREALTQWKAVVRLVQDADMSHPIFVNLFGAVLSTVAPELFSVLVSQQVFIGYTLSQKERCIVNEQQLQQIVS